MLTDVLFSSGKWWGSLSTHTMTKYVKVWTQALSAILSSEPVPLKPSVILGVKNMLNVLQHMYNVSVIYHVNT